MNQYEINKRIKDYEENTKLIKSGRFKYVPFHGFPKLQRYIPGIVPGIMYKVTSHSGMGKTQLSKYLFTYQSMLYAIKNNINFKVIYFALEESKEEFIDGLFIHILKRVYNVQLDRFSLMGTSRTPLTEVELDAIRNAEVMLANLVSNMEIIDNVYKPTDIYNKCKYFAKKWGKFKTLPNGDEDDMSYVANDPDQIVLTIVDHISLLENEFDTNTNSYLSDHKTISKWHTIYAKRIISKFWKWAILNVQQQSLESERQQFTTKGDTIINKILPAIDGLANNKEVGRDDMVVIGLFAPERYSIEKLYGYNIKNNDPNDFGDRFRSVHLLKNRFGPPNKVLPLYFDGRFTYFRELPLPTDPNMKIFHKLLKT